MRVFIIICVLTLLTGCETGTGPFGQNYMQIAPENVSKDIIPLKKWQMPQYYQSRQIETDIASLRARGFIILGSSSFRDKEYSFAQAANHALTIGATHIIYSQNVTGMEISKGGDTDGKVKFIPAGLMGFAAAAPPLSKIDINKIVTSGSSNNNTQIYYNGTYYNQPDYPVSFFDFKTYFTAKRQRYENYFGLTLGDYDGTGAIITDIKSGSVGDQLRLKKMDVITNINETPVATRAGALDILFEINDPGTTISLFITRNDEQFITVIPPIFEN